MDPITSAPDYAAARSNMVDSQVRPNKVTDPRVLDAMRALPREEFVPPALSPVAYVDEDLPLGGGRVLMEPMVIARLVQLARVRPGERALVIGAGTGYGAALVAACGAEVTALDDDEALLAIALRVLPRYAPAVKIVHGALSAGLPEGAPWDFILLEGAVTAIPPALAARSSPAAGWSRWWRRRDWADGRCWPSRPERPRRPGCARAKRSIATPRCCRACAPPLRSCFSDLFRL
ncbi:MAG: protein-L-isoaspartate O-methyltransferase [Acetobacteraceae bacterium]